MTADFNVKKYTVPLKEWIAARNQRFLEINILLLKELFKQTMDDCNISRQNKYPYP